MGNPAVSGDIEIFSTAGKLISRQSVVEDQPIPVNNLPKGYYLIRVHNNNIHFFGKLIVE